MEEYLIHSMVISSEAVLKALGSQNSLLLYLIFQLSIAIAVAGCFVGLILFFPVVALIVRLIPEISVLTTVPQLLAMAGMVTLISLISAVAATRGMRRIYAEEAFSS